MSTFRWKIDVDRPDPQVLDRVLDVLAQGEPVAVPTETVYGLACRPDISGAVERIYAVKGRPEDKPLPRMVATVDQVRALVTEWPDAAERLASCYWPGPLTLILRVSGGTVAYRIPDHPVLQALLTRCPAPLAVTSANRSGEPAARNADEVEQALGAQSVIILDAGPARIAQASTIVDVTRAPDEIRILRTGALDHATIHSCVQGRCSSPS